MPSRIAANRTAADVLSVLTQLGLEKYNSRFQDAEVDFETLALLSADDVAALLPTIGARAKFRAHLKSAALEATSGAPSFEPLVPGPTTAVRAPEGSAGSAGLASGEAEDRVGAGVGTTENTEQKRVLDSHHDKGFGTGVVGSMGVPGAVQLSGQQFKSTKMFRGFPCCHRQWRDKGHCAYLHGYDRSVRMIFACRELDGRGWVVDFGGLKRVKMWLEHWFDHTTLIAEDDPELEVFKDLHERRVLDLRILPGVGMEVSSAFIHAHVNPVIQKLTGNRCWVESVECIENDKNSAIFQADVQ